MLRLYSSTEYISVLPQLSGNWHDLSLASWEAMEDSLVDRFDSIMAAVQRTNQETGSLVPGLTVMEVVENQEPVREFRASSVGS